MSNEHVNEVYCQHLVICQSIFQKKTFVEQIASRYSFRKPLDSVRCCLVVRETSVRYKSLFRRLTQ